MAWTFFSLGISASSDGEDTPTRNAIQNDRAAKTVNAQHDGAVDPGVMPSVEEARTLAESLIAAMAENDVERAKPFFAFDQFFDRFAGNKKYSAESRREIIEGLREPATSALGSIGGIIRGPLDTYQKFLRVRTRDGQPHALVRTIRDDESVGYLELRLSKNADGAVIANDIFLYGGGEYYSTLYRQMYLLLMVKENSEAVDGEEEVSAEQAAKLKALERMMTALNEGRIADGLAEHRALPMDVRDSKMVLVTRAKFAMQLDVESAEQAIADLHRLYPNDPASNLILIDYYSLRRRFRESLKCIDLLDKAVGGDPYLHTKRASVYLATSDFRAARRSAEMAVAAEPDLVQSRLTLINCAMLQKDFTEVARQLLVMENELGQEIADLTRVSGYGAFVRSPEYRTWMAQRGRTSKAGK